MNTSLILSICIPTFERAECLEKTLTHLTNLSIFHSSTDWEIVISDNASKDSTQTVATRFAKQHPLRIRYFRNDTNVGDDNFRLVLSRGNGMFLKLYNDTLLPTNDGISSMLSAIRAREHDKPNLYFRSVSTQKNVEQCKSFDQFVRSVGYMCTWIAEYGIWKSDFQMLDDFGRARELHLIQVDATFRILEVKPKTIIYRDHFFDSTPKPKHGGYAPSVVFGQHYFTLMRPYVRKNLISTESLNLDKYRMFRYVILPDYLITSPSFEYPRTDYIQNLWPEYKTKWYFYFFIPFVALAIPIAFIRRHIGK